MKNDAGLDLNISMKPKHFKGPERQRKRDESELENAGVVRPLGGTAEPCVLQQRPPVLIITVYQTYNHK